MSGRRFKRWLLPAAVLPLALGAVGLLAVDLLFPSAPATFQRGAPSVPEPQEIAGDPGWGSDVAPVALAPPAPRDPVAPTRASSSAPRGGRLEARLRAARTLGERLELLDEHVARLTTEQARRELERLLDRPAPGTRYEAQELRLRTLSKLGELGGEQAEARLIRHIRPEVPRPERLLALELLAAHSPAGAGTIQAVAASDHDRVVRDRARWVVARGRAQ